MIEKKSCFLQTFNKFARMCTNLRQRLWRRRIGEKLEFTLNQVEGENSWVLKSRRRLEGRQRESMNTAHTETITYNGIIKELKELQQECASRRKGW